jgi:hypothetical protein
MGPTACGAGSAGTTSRGWRRSWRSGWSSRVAAPQRADRGFRRRRPCRWGGAGPSNGGVGRAERRVATGRGPQWSGRRGGRRRRGERARERRRRGERRGGAAGGRSAGRRTAAARSGGLARSAAARSGRARPPVQRRRGRSPGAKPRPRRSDRRREAPADPAAASSGSRDRAKSVVPVLTGEDRRRLRAARRRLRGLGADVRELLVDPVAGSRAVTMSFSPRRRRARSAGRIVSRRVDRVPPAPGCRRG